MALSIRNPAVEESARRYAALKNISVTAAIGEALKRQLALEEEEHDKRARELMRVIREVQARVAEMPIIDARHYKDIIYDEHGLPR